MERFFSFHCRGRDGRIPDGNVGLESFPGDQEMSRGYRIKKSGDDRVSKAFSGVHKKKSGRSKTHVSILTRMPTQRRQNSLFKHVPAFN